MTKDVEFLCPPEPAEQLPLTAHLAVGFGEVTVTKDDETVWSGDDWDVLLGHFERRALKEPGLWRVQFYGPLIGTTYERKGKGDWRLIERNEGFA